MTSQLLDKLEILKSNEIKIKEEQRFLVEQISLEMEKKRRLKLEGTLKKLEVQVDELDINGWKNERKGKVEQIELCYILNNEKKKIVPLFRTMIGIMEKQQKEIGELKLYFEKLNL